MYVSASAPSAAQQHHLLAVGSDIAEVFACFGIEGDGAAGYFDDAVFAVFTGTAFAATSLSGGSEDMAFKLEVE